MDATVVAPLPYLLLHASVAVRWETPHSVYVTQLRLEGEGLYVSDSPVRQTSRTTDTFRLIHSFLSSPRDTPRKHII